MAASGSVGAPAANEGMTRSRCGLPGGTIAAAFEGARVEARDGGRSGRERDEEWDMNVRESRRFGALMMVSLMGVALSRWASAAGI